jgi:spore coat polysaccharide biosynthesis predicted glycosyltransferase SpsG
MRCLAVAEELRRKSHDVIWLIDSEPIPWLARLLESEWTVLRQGQSEQSTEAISALSPDMVLLDSYSIARETGSELRARGIQVTALVDEATPHYDADLYVSPALGTDWRAPVPDAPFFSGPDFVLIRQELKGLCDASPTTQARPVVRVACLFGGSDVRDMASFSVQSLLDVGQPLNIDVVPDSPSLEAMSKKVPPGIQVTRHVPGPRVMQLALEADLVISAAGVSSWELLYMGVELGLIQVAENQEVNYNEMTVRGWAVALGRLPDLKRIQSSMVDWVSNRDPLRAPPGSRGTDGNGAARIVVAMEAQVSAAI